MEILTDTKIEQIDDYISGCVSKEIIANDESHEELSDSEHLAFSNDKSFEKKMETGIEIQEFNVSFVQVA